MLLRCRRHQTDEAGHPEIRVADSFGEYAGLPGEYLAPSDHGLDGAVRLVDVGPGDGAVVPAA